MLYDPRQRPGLGSADAGKRLLVLRGDLCSRTGYAAAGRALLNLIPPSHQVVGVDIHPDPDDEHQGGAITLWQDKDVLAYSANAAVPPIVVHHTAPDEFRFFPGCRNIGCFYWETDAAPLRREWGLKMNFMDVIWAPTSFVAEFARKSGFEGPIELVPWAHEFGETPARAGAACPSVNIMYVQRLAIASGRMMTQCASLATVRRQAKTLFCAVQSLAPRKGIRLLLNEWRSYLRLRTCRDILLLRLSFRHADDIDPDPMRHFANLLVESGFQDGELIQIALVTEPLAERELRGLYRVSDAFVTATFGEGFCGPIVEALQNNCLPIAPRHTGIRDLLAPDFPFIVESRRVIVSLKGNETIYPHATSWHVPLCGSISSNLARFERTSASDRAGHLARARAHVEAFCATRVVRQRIAAALAQLENDPSRATLASWSGEAS